MEHPAMERIDSMESAMQALRAWKSAQETKEDATKSGGGESVVTEDWGGVNTTHFVRCADPASSVTVRDEPTHAEVFGASSFRRGSTIKDQFQVTGKRIDVTIEPSRGWDDKEEDSDAEDDNGDDNTEVLATSSLSSAHTSPHGETTKTTKNPKKKGTVRDGQKKKRDDGVWDSEEDTIVVPSVKLVGEEEHADDRRFYPLLAASSNTETPTWVWVTIPVLSVAVLIMGFLTIRAYLHRRR